MGSIFLADVKTSDAAWHPDEVEGFYELWDFYSLYEQGYKCIIDFFSRPWYPLCEYQVAEANLPLIIVRITTPDNVTHVCSQSYPVSSFKASTETCDITMGNNRVTSKSNASGFPEEFHVKVAEGNLAADLTWRVRVRGIKMTAREDGFSYYHPVTKQYFASFTIAVSSEIEGTITVNGKSTKVSGIGFNNYNRGTKSISDIQSRWLFAAIYAGDYTIYYNDSTATKQYKYAHFTPFILWKGSEVILSTYNCASYPERFDIDPVSKGPYPVEETLRASDENIEVKGRLLPGVLVENTKVTDLPGSPFTPTNPAFHFFQFSEAELEIKRGEQVEKLKGQAVREFTWLDEWFPYRK